MLQQLHAFISFYLCKLNCFSLDKQKVLFEDLGIINYKTAWDYQEKLSRANLDIKAEDRKRRRESNNEELQADRKTLPTINHLIFCEHPAVYTLGTEI